MAPTNHVDQNSSNDEKVRLFRSLFGGRGDVFARRFENAKTGKKGGFGNLIALPLQSEARKIDNSVFVDDDWVPYRDQWAF